MSPKINTKVKSAEEVGRAVTDAVAARDLDKVISLWHADGILDFVADRVLRGTDEIRAYFEETFAAFPDWEMTVSSVTADESTSVFEWRVQGTFTAAPYQGIMPNGKHIELRGIDRFEVENGKVVKETVYFDAMTMARGMGLMPPKDSAPEKAMLAAFNATTKIRGAIAARRP